MSIQKNRKLMEEVRDYMRLHHYSIHTERTYCDWIKKFVQFHDMKSRNDLSKGEKKIELFLTHLAVQGNVSPSTQNQAMNALVFLYKKVLNLPLDDEINAVRAHKKSECAGCCWTTSWPSIMLLIRAHSIQIAQACEDS